MALKCVNCQKKDAVVVCHHCGKPLCKDKNCSFEEEDKAFSGKGTKAFHCSDHRHNEQKHT